jgi:predicted methyltransferase
VEEQFKIAKARANRIQETEAERWSRIEEQEKNLEMYTSQMYSQVYMNTDGKMYYAAEDGKKFRLIDEKDEVVNKIKEVVEIEKAQIKDRALLI